MTVILRYHKSVNHRRIIIPTSDLCIQLFQTIQETYHTTPMFGEKNTTKTLYTRQRKQEVTPPSTPKKLKGGLENVF